MANIKVITREQDDMSNQHIYVLVGQNHMGIKVEQKYKEPQ